MTLQKGSVIFSFPVRGIGKTGRGHSLKSPGEWKLPVSLVDLSPSLQFLAAPSCGKELLYAASCSAHASMKNLQRSRSYGFQRFFTFLPVLGSLS
mmetsp:Transcript_69343/g.162322  ORF Transcript_69343/g.162322 Transcript_69343/m.162322 type:complete len:95 (-) Transcript_69343:1148-1432(-)